jgi:hypothetical protein
MSTISLIKEMFADVVRTVKSTHLILFHKIVMSTLVLMYNLKIKYGYKL